MPTVGSPRVTCDGSASHTGSRQPHPARPPRRRAAQWRPHVQVHGRRRVQRLLPAHQRDLRRAERADRHPDDAPGRRPRGHRSAAPAPAIRAAEDEMAIIPLLEHQIAHGYRPFTLERYMRVALRQPASHRRDVGGRLELRGDWTAPCEGRQRGTDPRGTGRGVGRDDRSGRAGSARDLPRPAEPCLHGQHPRRVRSGPCARPGSAGEAPAPARHAPSSTSPATRV